MEQEEYIWKEVLESRRDGHMHFKMRLRDIVLHEPSLLSYIPASHMGLILYELKHVFEECSLDHIHECLTLLVPYFRYNYEMTDHQTCMDRIFFSYLPKHAFKNTRTHGLFFTQHRSVHLTEEESLMVSFQMMKNYPEEWHYFMPQRGTQKVSILHSLVSESILHRLLFAVVLHQRMINPQGLFFAKEHHFMVHIPLLASMHIAEDIDSSSYSITHDYEILRHF